MSKKTYYASQYTVPNFIVDAIELNFTLDKTHTHIIATTHYRKNVLSSRDLILNGENIKLKSVKINDIETQNYHCTETLLTIKDVPDEFTLEITNTLNPAENTFLEGLYVSGGHFCTQCEAEGFRRITYFQDRPDVLAPYTVHITADKKQYPVLLSNGQQTAYTENEDGTHTAVWYDSTPKPCYLFALVAGDLAGITDSITNSDGQSIALKIYTDHGNENRLDYAMDSLKRSIRWDEEKWGRIYDYDVFHIVAVNDFNMGAMENTSLNIFNASLILADPETATDQDYQRIEAVVAHEFFHHWTGNRITCRDWFQLSLKEGLTVFRDQQFTGDMRSHSVKRIQDVKTLRSHQFKEDASGLAHPVRPESYQEINNFYTATVYEKGAELIRMQHTLLGKENFYKGAEIYFDTFDGQAVTCDDWVACLEKASNIDLTHFKLWYSQAGTPVITLEERYENGQFDIIVQQNTPDTPNQTDKKPLHIPLAVGCFDGVGKDVLSTQVLELTQNQQIFHLGSFDEKPTLSFNRGFSAPVIVKGTTNITVVQKRFMFDNDTFNRWQAGQDIALHCVLHHMQNNTHDTDTCNAFVQGVKNVLKSDFSTSYKSLCITMPSLSDLHQHIGENVNPQTVYASYQAVKAKFADILHETIESYIAENPLPASFNPQDTDAGMRALDNALWQYYSITVDTTQLQERYNNAYDLTTRFNALSGLCQKGQSAFALRDFKNRYNKIPTVMNKYFAVQVATDSVTPENVSTILQDSLFSLKNPNNARAVLATYAQNPIAFHLYDGAGYMVFAKAVIELDTLNPQTAAVITKLLGRWKIYTKDVAEKMQDALRYILEQKNLSTNLSEVAQKALQG